MDKYDYITATIEEEKIRIEKIISYLKEKGSNELIEYQERYNNILKYLNTKKEYLNIEKNIKEDKKKLNNLGKQKDEYEVDNILLEDTLLSKFHEDTGNIYRNLLYENIKNEKEDIRDILYLLYEKQSSYNDLVLKRNKLNKLISKKLYPNTYNTLMSQGILIEKQNNIMDEVFLIENNIKIAENKQKELIEEVMTPPILKILYEFWIIDSYDPNKVNKRKIFEDNRTLVSIKNNIPDIEEKTQNEEEKSLISDLNLPGVNENILINIEGKKYIEKT